MRGAGTAADTEMSAGEANPELDHPRPSLLSLQTDTLHGGAPEGLEEAPGKGSGGDGRDHPLKFSNSSQDDAQPETLQAGMANLTSCACSGLTN